MKLKQYLKYLYIPGLVLVSAGIVANFVSPVQSPLYLGLIIVGAIILVIWFALSFQVAQGFWRRRSTQVGTDALLATLAVLVIVGLLNFLAVSYPIRADLTENQLFSLSPQTERLLTNLPNPVKVWVFERGSTPNSIDRELLEDYHRKNENFEFEFIDPDKTPGVVNEFKQLSSGNLYKAYIQYGDNKQPIQTLDTEEALSEVKLTNAIESIQSDRIFTVYFLQGHGEHPLNAKEGGLLQAVNGLEEKGYKIEPLNLVQLSAIPKDTDVIIITGAKRKLFPQEVEALKTYSEQGGSLLLLLDPDTDIGLESLLKTWGIKLDDRLIIDGSGAGELVNLGPAFPIVTTYGNHPITQDFNDGISIYPYARPIGTVEVKDVEAVALLITSEQMWAESDLNSEAVQFDEGKDLAGPFDLGVALTRKVSKSVSQTKDKSETISSPNSPLPSPSPPENTKEEPKESKLVVVGNSVFATDGWFEQQLNGDVFLNSVQWLSNRDAQTLSIRAKEPSNRRVNLTPLQANTVFWLSIFLMPLVGFILAGLTWWRRR